MALCALSLTVLAFYNSYLAVLGAAVLMVCSLPA